MGGEIGYADREGGGTSFHFQLPAHAMPAGGVVFVIESGGTSATQPYVSTAGNLYLQSTTGVNLYLCRGPCSAASVIDVVQFNGSTYAATALLAGITF